MYIRKIRIKNYLIHQDTEVDLSPLTVFVGPNGGGKSALFDAILNFSMLARGGLRQSFGPYPFSFRATRYRGASEVARIRHEVVLAKSETDTEALTYLIDYGQTGASDDPGLFTIFDERLVNTSTGEVLFDRSNPDDSTNRRYSALPVTQDRSLFAAHRYALLDGRAESADDLFTYCTQQVSRFNKFRLDPFVLSQVSRITDAGDSALPPRTPRLGYHGEELAATLYHLSETNQPLLDQVKEKIRETEPEFVDFEFNLIGNERVGFSAVYKDGRGAVTAVRLSSGMLNLIGLIVLILSPGRPSLLMIEEPENGLTPQAVKCFYRTVRELAFAQDDESRSQILISSHSPFVICDAWNGEDRDFIHQVKVEGGKARVRKFTEVVKEQGIHLSKGKDGRTQLGLRNAEEIMSGYLS